MTTLDELRIAADEAWSKINRNPERINELDDADLDALDANVSTALPITRAALIAKCGDIDAANEALRRVQRYSQGRLVKLVRSAVIAFKAKRDPSANQCAALYCDFTVGSAAIAVERERRQARSAGRVN